MNEDVLITIQLICLMLGVIGYIIVRKNVIYLAIFISLISIYIIMKRRWKIFKNNKKPSK